MSKNKSLWHNGDMLLLNNSNLFNNCWGDADKISNADRLTLYYVNLALTRFKWSGDLPKGLTSRKIEEYLFFKGQVFFCDTEKFGLLCLPCSPTGEYNVYNEPLKYNIVGNGFTDVVNADDGVRIMNNDMCLPDFIHIQHYVYINSLIEKTQQLNLVQQRTPNIVGTNKRTELSMKQIYSKIYDDFEPSIYVDESIEQDLTKGTNVFKTDAPYILDKLQQFKYEKESELFSFLGINNSNHRKKERMVVDEVNANNGQILMSIEIAYKNRLLACREINERFGLNLKVEKVMTLLDEAEVNQNIGGVNND